METLGGDLKEDGVLVGFEVGFDAVTDVLEEDMWVTELEALRSLPAGSLVRDARGRTLFKTQANGWWTVGATHVSAMYIKLPAELLHHG